MATRRPSHRVRGCRGHFWWPLAAAPARDHRATRRARREARSNLPLPATSPCRSPSIKDRRFGAAKWLLTIFDAGLCPMSRWNPLLHCSPVDSVAAPSVAGAQQLSYFSGQVVVSTAAVDKRSGRTTSTMTGRCRPRQPHGRKHAAAGSARIGRAARSVGRALVDGGAPAVGRVCVWFWPHVGGSVWSVPVGWGLGKGAPGPEI